MNTETFPKLIALTGGSGAGKSWLADRLLQEFGDEAASLSLDDFYRDLSHLVPSERETINFDHPNAIDWPLFEHVLRDLKNGGTTPAPRYDFVSHSRWIRWELHSPRPFIFVEGLWLLWPPRLRELFDLWIFLDCPETLRLQRRLARDVNERGRTADSIREQFRNTVAPMHDRFVEAQKAWADLVIDQPIRPAELDRLMAAIRALRIEPAPAPLEINSSRSAIPQLAALHSI